MKRMTSILLGGAALLFMAGLAGCEQQNQEPDSVALEIVGHSIAESAFFGETIEFSVTMPEDAAVQSLTAAIIYGGKQLVSSTVREGSAGTFAGTLSVPYTKNIEDGEYDVMFMALGATSSERAEKTVKISLAHPEFTSVVLAAVDGTRYELAADEETPSFWSLKTPLPAELSGKFEAKDAEGTAYVFGGAGIDNVEFGNSSDIEFYSYDAPVELATIGFDVRSFAVTIPLNATYVVVPETVDVANPGTIDVEFKKGQVVVFENLGDLWVDVDFFDRNDDGTYTFRAEGGYYRLTNQSDWGALRTERVTANGALATFDWDENGNITVNEAIWCHGNYNYGKPDKRAVRSGRVFSDWDTYDGYCMAKIDDYKYQITLRVYNYASWKFFKTKLEWGDITSANYDMANSTIDKCFIISVAGSDGNFQQGQNIADPNKYEYPLEGLVLRFTFDVSDPLGIKVLVEEAEM